MRITRELVIQTASELADRDGLSRVSLKAVAEALRIRTPSLYNHVESLESLLREVAHTGMRDMNREMERAAVGVSGDEAIQTIGRAYLRYMIAHPGVYETIQWALWHQNGRTRELYADYCALLERIVASLDTDAGSSALVVRLLAGFLHGYTTQRLGSALTDPDAAILDLKMALEIVLLGIHRQRDG